MPPKLEPKQRGIIAVLLAVIIAGICLLVLVPLFAMGGPWLKHLLGGLSGGGDQPGGNCNIGCGFDTSKINLYTQGDSGGVTDATSDAAKNFAVGTLKVDASQIVAFDKNQVENLIRAEIVKQWSALSTEQQHGATQADAQHAVLAYQFHEDSSFQMFVNSGGGLKPKHDGSTIQLLSITSEKYGGNKRKEIALNWDIKYTIYTGVQENIDAFESHVSGSGADRWKQAIAYVFLPANPNCYWTNPNSPCRSGAANEGWTDFQNEATYICQSVAGCGVAGSGPCGQSLVNIAVNEIGREERRPCDDAKLRNCVKYNEYKGFAWCDTFVDWVYKQTGFDYLYLHFFGEFDDARHYMQQNQIYIDVRNGDTSQIRPGDYFWLGGNDIAGQRHAGMIESVSGKEIHTIEGNTGGEGVVSRQVHTAGNGHSDIKAVARLKSCSL